MTEMFEAIDRGELTTMFVLGENPVQSDADAPPRQAPVRRLEHVVVQDIFRTTTAEIADVVLPASASWCEAEGTVTNSERRVQRVRAALEPPGQARDDIRIIVDLAARLGHQWEYGSSEDVWNELRSLAPEPRRHELRAPGGARRHPVAVLRRGAARAESFLHGRLWKEPREGPPAVFHAVEDVAADRGALGGVPAAPHDRPAPGLVQHRRADRRLHVAAAARRGARAVDRRRRASSASTDGDRVRVSSARGSVVAPVRIDPSLRPGPGVHDAALPRRGGDEPAHHQRHRPQVRHRGVQGDRHPRRPDRARRGRGDVGRAASALPR